MYVMPNRSLEYCTKELFFGHFGNDPIGCVNSSVFWFLLSGSANYSNFPQFFNSISPRSTNMLFVLLKSTYQRITYLLLYGTLLINSNFASSILINDKFIYGLR